MQAAFLRPLVAFVLFACPVAAGEVIVTSWNTNEVLRYDADTGAFLGVLVASGVGGLQQPHSACFGADGTLYVTSFGNDRVLRYEGDTGNFLGAFVAPGAGGLNGPTSVSFGPDGHLYVTSYFTPGVLRYDGMTGASLGALVSGAALMANAEAGQFGPDGHYYLANGPGNNVLRFDGVSGASMGVFAAGGSLNDPHEMDFGPNGNLFVTSFGSNRVNEYDGVSGAFVGEFVSPGSGLVGPHGLCFTGDGRFHVVAFSRNRINTYDALTGEFLGPFVAPGVGGVNGPISITPVPESSLVVAYGSGVNPVGSLTVLSGAPVLGGSVEFGVDNPLGTQGPGSSGALFLSLGAHPLFPAGPSFRGFGMAGAGAPGELLISLPDVFRTLVGGPYAGPGQPLSFSVMIPGDLGLVGVSFFTQGLLRDPAAIPPAGAANGLTDALSLRIGLP